MYDRDHPSLKDDSIYVRPYGCFDSPFDKDICHYHHDDARNRLDPRCRGCRHQMVQWREMGRAKKTEEVEK